MNIKKEELTRIYRIDWERERNIIETEKEIDDDRKRERERGNED